MDDQSSPGVPCHSVLMWSMAAAAAEAAEDRPRAAMIAAPRLATVSKNSPLSQASSFTTAGADCPVIWAWRKSGNMVFEWLPHTATWLTAPGVTPARRASWALARFSSRRVMAWMRSLGRPGALCRAMRAFVFAGQRAVARLDATTRTRVVAPCRFHATRQPGMSTIGGSIWKA